MKPLSNSILKQFRNGDNFAFKKIYERYFDALYLFGMKYISTQDVMEDILQEIFIKAWEKRAYFFHDLALKAFLYKSVKNACFNHIEHQSVKKKFENRHDESSYDENIFFRNIIEEEVNRQISEAVQELPESARIIYLLSLNGVKNKEIAEDLKISINTVKTQKLRANRFLKEKLKKQN
ncbi:RNA polymerase sigma-70 factor [Ancylomarina euxinus]|uniref:RNA polymerase sigma-70 factor n=1 Tax=Ancylomarina euxinus TaxID=2283627 RepID=A0A425XZJ5_9BACT|nr:RNA polymerase sigma-70 factor [Ancylomarina euxinus]MCZ4695469.1 RNA polymerase sigma-70 factor [Ancylomarina euxinus]MUP15713.1 RNA polymerase sigma-70 factor [Ancylomarina euxinus]RRG20705.1 RNA polymerase sigma-70 factor [Ancylomarina euxinus]